MAAQNPIVEDETFVKEWTGIETAFANLLDAADDGFKLPPDWIRQNMETYAKVYNLCTRTDKGKQASPMLYQKAKEMIEKYLAARVTAHVVGKKGEELLQRLYKAWESHQVVVKWARHKFSYLDNYYTKSNQVDNLRIMMLRCFMSAVYEKIKVDLKDQLLEKVEQEREGNTIDRVVMKEAINLFVEMGLNSNKIYEADFEAPFVEQTGLYYARVSASWLAEEGGIHYYLKRVEASLNSENQRCISILNTTSLPKVMRKVEEELLTKHQTQVLKDGEGGTEALLANWKVPELTRMYTLFARVDGGLDAMSEIVRDYIKEEGKQLNSQFASGALDNKGYIDAALDLQKKYSKLFREAFSNHSCFFKARKQAFEVFINETLPLKNSKITSSELLSSYCDTLMKNEKMTPDELEAILEAIVDLFTFISDKDLFQEFYRKLMSKRLLVSKTDNDNERSLISKLKLKMGAPYTAKLEGMITDKNVGTETTRAFVSYCKDHKKTLAYDFTAQVLTTGHWPAFKIDPLNPPRELGEQIAIFTEYYNSQSKCKVLKWVHSLGIATIAAEFKKAKKEMIVSTFQACCLLAFNEKSEHVAGQLAKDYGLAFEEIKKNVLSLAFGKFPVLKKKDSEDKKKTVLETDTFIVNEAFSTASRKFKIPGVTRSAVAHDPQQTTDESRKFAMDACIVRIMKARKQLTHVELSTECIKHLSTLFKPDPRLIKKRIEDLIGRAYLERDEEDRNLYRYLA
eukprot:TRINITY_DN93635_c0_g1_i1.p1 TRINITY_DN93635_c0_g1~~TRINITY_DN93635_c0_g1_i1.p1  ORF type:complete len:741 (+),score=123.99 TRINITY_DN93635_c0_g1_i1:62-2284(+)